MYSGTTLRTKSGRILGVHQKIDRVARKHIEQFLPQWCNFPSAKQILAFEGKNGPDGIKRKSPAVDEPWHFIDPSDPSDTALLDMIDLHRKNLTAALKGNNQERASFEAAWMAHAITDGLTPAHHFPFEEAIKELRSGEGNETRSSLRKKNIMHGDGLAELFKNNWKYWGAKGVMTAHMGFEAGVASVIAYKRFNDSVPSEDDLKEARQYGFRKYFLKNMRQVADINMYDEFLKKGWTLTLAAQTNQMLMPIIIKSVIVGWLSAIWAVEQDES